MNPPNGWLVLNKPAGISSAKAVAIVKRHLRPKKIGHAGTLDPLASGVLPLALGEATKTVNFCLNSDKEYEFTVKWGQQTATDDSEGEIIAASEKIPSDSEINTVLDKFRGDINQVPPQYSAIKKGGKKAYEIARAGGIAELVPRKVMVNVLELTGHSSGCSHFKLACSKGTYVRSLARDMGVMLGCYGHVTRLLRTKAGKFSIKDAILLENIEKKLYTDDSSDFLLPVEAVLDDIPALAFTPEEATAIRHGKMVEKPVDLPQSSPVYITCEGKPVAIGSAHGGKIKPVRVFNL